VLSVKFNLETPLKIGILHYSCPPVIGGVEEVLGQQAVMLDRFGQSISILSGTGKHFHKSFPVRIEPLISSQNPSIKKNFRQWEKGNLEAFDTPTEQILRILVDWSKNLDVILAHNVLHMPFNLPLTLALRRLADSGQGPALVSWAHDSPFFHASYPEYLDEPPWPVLREAHPNIHYVTISHSRKESFEEKIPGAAWKVISNGIEPSRLFYLDPVSRRLSEQLDLFSRDLVVIQPARITPRKNIELSIHIVNGLKKMNLDVLLVLTGAYDPHESRAPAYYRRLKYWINELGLTNNIALLAELISEDQENVAPDRAMVRDFYLMADLLLMTSKDEGFGLPLLEAGLLKLPIACSEIPSFVEIGKDICFFRLDDPPLATSGRILEYLTQMKTHQMYRSVVANYVWDGVCKKQLLPFLREITAQDQST
jgi:glycosyltransferase involved in cell wall biosynthesis